MLDSMTDESAGDVEESGPITVPAERDLASDDGSLQQTGERAEMPCSSVTSQENCNNNQEINQDTEEKCDAVAPTVEPFDFQGEAGMVLDLLKVSCELPGLKRAYKTVVNEIVAFNGIVEAYNGVVSGRNWSPGDVASLELTTGVCALERVDSMLPDLKRLLGSLGSVLVEMDCLDLANLTSNNSTGAAYSQGASRQSRRELIGIIENFLCPSTEKMLQHARCALEELKASERFASVVEAKRKRMKEAQAPTPDPASSGVPQATSPCQAALASYSNHPGAAVVNNRRRGRDDTGHCAATTAASADFTLPDAEPNELDDVVASSLAQPAEPTKSVEGRRRGGGRWKRSKKKDPPVDWSAKVREKIEQYKNHTRGGGMSTNFFNVPPDLKTQLRLLADCELQLKGCDESGVLLPSSSRSVTDLKVIIETYIAALELAYKYLSQLRVNTAQLQLLYSHTVILEDLQTAEDLLPNLSFIISFLKTFETF